MEAARNRALKAVAKQVKASVWEKILAWRYMGMLGTVRMNEVNALANTAGYVAAVIKDVVGGVFEPVVQTVANQQGKNSSVLNPSCIAVYCAENSSICCR